MTVNPAAPSTYPSKPSAIAAQSGIVVSNITGGGITGSGAAGQVTLFSGASTVIGDTGFTFNGSGANIEIDFGLFDGAHAAARVFQGQVAGVQVLIAPKTINAPAPADQQSLIVRRVGAAQTANVVEITDELFAVQLAVDKTGLLFPGVAAGVGLGSGPKPFSGVFVGNAANQSGRITGTFTGNKTITFPDNTGTVAELNLAQSWTAKQTFTPTATVAGLNVGSVAGDPSTPVNADLWYDSTGNALRARINGATISLGAGSPGAPSTSVQFNVGGTFTGDANFEWDNVNKQLVLGAGSTGAPSYSFAGSQTTGLYNRAAGRVTISCANNDVAEFGGGELEFVSSAAIFFDTGALGGASDIRIRRSAAKTLAVDDGAGGVCALSVAGVLNAAAATATPAAGSAAARLLLGTTAGFGIYYGSNAPTVSAAQGSLYLRSDGSTAVTRAYINTDGGTTWTALTTQP